MKHFQLNLKGLYGYSQSVSPRTLRPSDEREMSERQPSEERTLLAPVPQRFARYAAMLIMLLTIGVGQMWASRTFKSGEVIYFKDTWKANGNGSTWKVGGDGKLYAYFYGDGDYWENCGTIITSSWNEANALYAFTVPGDNKTYTGVIFTRGTGPSWDNTWNQTMNQTPDEGKDLFCVNNTTTKNDNKDKYNGTWYTFSQYAYIEGRFHVQTAPGSDTWTNTFSTGDWNESSTAIPMTWDATNKRFYLHTYATLKNLTDNISDQGPVFYIKTAHISANLTDGTGGYDASYQANTSTTFTSSNGLAGSKIQLHTSGDGRANSNLKFDYSSGTNGYVVLYFTPSDGKIWYELEYQVNFGKGTGGNTVTATAGNSLNSGDCVLSGTSVTFAHTANTGYTWAEWNAAANGSGTQRSTDQSYTVTIDGSNTTNSAFTAYSQYTENKSNITIGAGDNGNITTPASLSNPYSLGVATKQAITATADGGYYFTGWTCTGTAAVDNPSSVSTYAKTDGTAGGTGTVTANFEKRWVLRGSREDGTTEEGMPGWSATTSAMNVSAGVSTQTVTLYPNRTYKYMIYDNKPTAGQRGCTSSDKASATQSASTAWTLDGSNHVYFNTAGYGEYTFTVAIEGEYPKVTITNPSSWMITMGQKTVTDGDWTPVDNEGGTISAKTTEAGTDFDISDGKYVRNGGTVTFTATPASGFMFDGWYDNSSCTGAPISTTREYAMENITSAKTVYAKFVEVTFNVNVFLGNDGNDETADWQTVKVGVKSHPSITANTISDQVFNRWEVIGSASFGDAYSKTTTVSGVTDAQTTVVATHKDPPTLYYVIERPTSWSPSTMYVYFYSNDYWNKDSGSGSGYGCMKVAQMTAVEGKNNKWWKYTFNPETDPELSGNSIASVSFMEYQQLSKNNFDGNNTGTHRDYHSCMNMFIVTTTGGTNHLNGNTCWYYNDGYWYNYEDNKSGYYLHNLPGDEVEFIADANGIYSASVNLEAAHDYYFYIGGCDGKNWANDEHYTGASHEHTLGIFDNISDDANKVHFTTSAGGIYKFKLTPIYNTADNSAHMKLNIIYPVQANDYRARYNNAASSPTISRPSNTISSDRDHGAISLWLNKGTNYITFEKATVDGSTGALTWTSVGTQQTVTDVPENGVYTMTLTRSGETYTVSSISPYTGDFYIRTDCASGGWKDYVINGMTNNTLTFDKDDASTFDYYYCKWIKDAGTNVRFAVANDLNIAISDTLIHDAALGTTGSEETLPEAANVRFAWNSHTNTLSRAYLSGATDPNDRFLILHGNEDGEENSLVLDPSGATIDHSGTYSNLRENEEYFSDKNDWVYQVELKAKSGAAIYLTAKYNGEDRPLYASSESPKAILTSSISSNSYPITATYDFKTNNMLIAWHPGDNPQIAEHLTGLPSVMVMREHQGDAEQITFNGGSIAGTRVYGVMNFNKWTLNNQDKSTHATYTGDASKSEEERSLFWISFPFDVRLKDVFGFGEYGRHWIIEYYDGAGRAKNGWWIDSDTNWKFVLADSLEHGGEEKQGYILKANVGYVLALDLVELTHASKIWNNDVEDVYLYFPSISTNVTINNSLPESVVVPKHECTIERDDRQSKDCNWNVIGVPIYANDEGLSQGEVKFFYAWNPKTNELGAEGATSTGVMHSMHAYMVQFAGTINWRTHTMTPASVAARRSENAPKDAYMFRLDLMQGGKSVDKTFVELSEDATISFDVNKDMTKMLKQTQSNIYTLVAGNEGNIQVAGNCLPLNTRQTTIVPVGVKILADGEFSFSMPEGTNGVGVILVDNNAGTRTNLSLTDYTIHLEAGQYDGRFLLEISPIAQTPTDIENVQGDDVQSTNVRKVMVDGILYIVKDGKIFDARGNRLQ